MDSAAEYVDPTDIAGVNERIRAWAGAGEAIRPAEIGHVVIADDALDALVELARSLGGGGRTLVVMDRTPMVRAGDDLKAVVTDRLASALPLTVRQVPDEAGRTFKPDIEWARRLAEDLRHYAAVVAVGSGSVTDVAKYARHLRAGSGASRVPMISFPTAASVTAYTSALAALNVEGVKRTFPARAPEAVVCDLRALAGAPIAMTRAGYGDVLARGVSYGDWYLACQLGMNDGFSRVPGRLLAHAEQAMIDRAESVAAAAPIGIRCLTEGLLLAGMAMSIANQTAPLSGWEHAISHFLDLTACAEGREAAFHGAQVGVATLVSARAYERFWPELDPDRILADADVGAFHRDVTTYFSRIDPIGQLTDEIWRDLEKKLIRWNSAVEARCAFAHRVRCREHDVFLKANVRASAEVAGALTRAQAPTRFADLNEPVSDEVARAAVLRSHWIRARFTLGDLLAQTGWLGDSMASALLDESGVDR